ncbi:beta-N-acetylhexosaminidase [Catalinimonas alkaloidigena]|uniref:beta-N-acetylhexosaminidase n=1 Tax=Catalinimonas alkaloidigena TaxID=1075417 RepID=A0A1G9RGT4_9BACT|nr:glycoside hydrolase family 3 N-terminal domain-containing protein [Catalinimonas alkaloidigena]SDM21645.1 beta-N-acetylhexosaminidase [Catalinimonas alkaloidigena]
MKNLLLWALSLSLFAATATAQSSYSLETFYQYQPALEHRVDQIFQTLSDTQRVGQMIIPSVGKLGKPEAYVANLVRKGQAGGILLLGGSKEGFTEQVRRLNKIAQDNRQLPIMFSTDAEPTLLPKKISGATPVPKTSALRNQEEAGMVASTISQDLLDIGVRHNFAPVADLSKNQEIIGARSFGANPDTVAAMNWAFMRASQRAGVVATAKHFPGHGLVQGDSHHKLVFINGPMQEVDVYRPLIDSGVVSVMVGHIAVENNPDYNTNGEAASTSHRIVTELLKNELGFRGLVVTDAMNMGAVSQDPQATVKAVKAGCDMILMPPNEPLLLNGVLAAMQKDPAFRDQVYASVKKIIRLKLCLGLIQ